MKVREWESSQEIDDWDENFKYESSFESRAELKTYLQNNSGIARQNKNPQWWWNYIAIEYIIKWH
jgi:hypothetical protein